MRLREFMNTAFESGATYEQLRQRALIDVDDGYGDWGDMGEAQNAALVFAVLALAEAVREQGGKP